MKRAVVVALLLALAVTGCGKSKTKSASGGTGGGGKYCSLATDLEKASASIETPDFSDPTKAGEVLRDAFAKVSAALDDVIDQAPSEIQADLRLLADAFRSLKTKLEAIDYDFTKADPETFKEFSDPKFQAASDRIEKYNERVCGIKAGASSTPSP